MLASFACVSLYLVITVCVLTFNYNKTKADDIVIINKPAIQKDLREQIIDELSRKKLVYLSSENCWVRRNQID